jgi:Bcr/CflA subfamily drug resistance transporter
MVSESWVEYTLTIYLFAFAIGIFFWGKLSDFYGRKPCLLIGLIIYVLGCIGCYFSDTITLLMISRFIQAFGGSVGSVLNQAICRDTFQGPDLGKAYSVIGSALSIFPAIGPIIGGLIAENYGWSNIFLFLILAGSIVWTQALYKLPETHLKENRNPVSIVKVAAKMIKDTRVLTLGFFVGACNGISFSYYAEGPFYLINLLGLSPSTYGITFIGIAIASMLGGVISRRLHNTYTFETILGYGLIIILIGSSIFLSFILVSKYLISIPTNLLISVTVISIMIICCGICMVASNALAMALIEYRYAIGTASSLFGFYYYSIVSLATLIMGYLHNGTLLPMPIYFWVIGISMWAIFKKGLLNKSRDT